MLAREIPEDHMFAGKKENTTCPVLLASVNIFRFPICLSFLILSFINSISLSNNEKSFEKVVGQVFVFLIIQQDPLKIPLFFLVASAITRHKDPG